ncbi:MAG: radical SAM family heme chaperone HemW [Anaerolineae bacterium]|nr:radical SAM family heme chaperone HemW [Anaerolineae bacterium]
MPPHSLYIHIPFCAIKCSYCAFNTYTHLDHLIEPFVHALMRELQILAHSQPGLPLHTVYIGGGTPSLLTVNQLSRILSTIRAEFALDPAAEISMESNPSDLHVDYLSALREIGITRLSIGMQSANQTELDLFARRHDFVSVIKAVESARQAGFDNVNLDLIYGIPHQSLADWETTLSAFLKLDVEHVSLYALGLEDGTSLKAWVESGRLPHPDDDLTADMYDLATTMLDAAGYDQYEISNWSRSGRECRHNLQYWRNLPYPGVGPGAHGYAGGVRYSTILSPQRYIKALNENTESFVFPRTPATDNAVLVERDAEIVETLIMGLRLTREGIVRQTFRDRFGIDLLDLHGEVIQRYVQLGLVHVDDEIIRITQAGRLLSSALFREFV